MHPDDRQLLHRSFGCAKKKNLWMKVRQCRRSALALWEALRLDDPLDVALKQHLHPGWTETPQAVLKVSGHFCRTQRAETVVSAQQNLSDMTTDVSLCWKLAELPSFFSAAMIPSRGSFYDELALSMTGLCGLAEPLLWQTKCLGPRGREAECC